MQYAVGMHGNVVARYIGKMAPAFAREKCLAVTVIQTGASTKILVLGNSDNTALAN